MHDVTVGTYHCPCCNRRWRDEVPPMWSALDCWPVCRTCDIEAPRRPLLLKRGALEAAAA